MGHIKEEGHIRCRLNKRASHIGDEAQIWAALFSTLGRPQRVWVTSKRPGYVAHHGGWVTFAVNAVGIPMWYHAAGLT